MKHAAAKAENAASRYSLSTKILAVFLSVVMTMTFSHFEAFAESVQEDTVDKPYVQAETSLENEAIADASTQELNTQDDIDISGSLPADAGSAVSDIEDAQDDADAAATPALSTQSADDEASHASAASDSAAEHAVNTYSVNHIGGFFNVFGGMNVVVKGSEGMLPADAKMNVSLVKDEAVEKMLETAAAAENKEMVDSVVVDITFTDVEGNVIEPKGPVSVNFEGVNLKGDSVGVYHVTDSLDKVTSIATLDSASDAFAAEHFSTYALIGKIDAQPVVPEGQKLVTVNYVSPDGSLMGKGHTEQIGIDETAISFTVLNDEMYGSDVTIGSEGGYELSVSAADQEQYGITISDNQQVAITNLPRTEQINIDLIVQGKETTYRVIEKTEKLNGTGEDAYDTKETVVGGRVGDIASFNPEQKEGFTATGFLDQVIKADASTVIEGTYDRNLYTLKYNTKGGSYIEPKSGVYEQEIPVFSASSSTILTCTKEEHEHTDVPSQAADRNKNTTIGCYTSTNHGWIWENWTWDLTCGKEAHMHSDACYTQTSAFDPEPTKTGYVFSGWYLDEACSVPASEKLALMADTTVYAKWTPMNVGYKVVYLVENADDDGYSYLTSADATAQVGTTVTAYATAAPSGLDTNNFTFASATTETVKADGSTVVTVKYTRNVYTVTWNGVYYDKSNRPKTASEYPGTPVTLTAKYGQNITSLWQKTFNDPYGKAWNFTTDNDDKFVTIDTMPSGNKEVYQFYFATDKKQTLHYWLEGYNADGAEQKEHNGVTYGLYKAMEVQFNYLYENSDFYEIAGYTKGDYEGCTFGGSTSNGQQVHFYYRANEYNLDLHGYQGALLGSYKLKLNANISSYLVEPEAPFAEAIFDGWFIDPEHTQLYTGNYQMPTGLVLYAGWHAPVKTVTVHLNYEGAGTAETIEVTKGETLNSAHLPSEEELEEHNPGYDFTGWYTDASCTTRFDQNRPIDEDTTIYAGWTKSTKVAYTVKHVAVRNGEEVEISSVEARGTIGQDVKVVKLTDEALATAGYEGYLCASGSSQFLKLSATATDNVVTFRYMMLDDLEYTVSYLYDGTTVFVENDGVPYKCKSDVAFSVYPNEEAQRWIAANGYSLKSTFVTVEPGQNAVFELLLTPYTITYDLQGGAFAKGVTAPETYIASQVSGANTISIPNPESVGRTFVGWTLTEGTYVNDSAAPSDTLEGNPQKNLVLGEVNGYKTIGHLTLKANWQDNAYAFVRFVDSNGSVVASDTLAQRFGLTAPADANGWYTLGYETVSVDKPASEYTAGTIVENAPDETYLTGIEFDVADLNAFSANVGFNDFDTIVWEQFAVEEGAYGYFDTPNAYHLNGSIQVDTVKYVDGVDGETVFSDVVGYGVSGDEYPQFGADPVRSGYVFTGWLAPDGTIMTTAEVEALTFSGDATYVAQWSEETYDVTYVSAGNGTVSNTDGDKDLFVLSADGVTGATAVANSGYTFEGWYKGDTFVTNAETLTPAMIEPQLNHAMNGSEKVYESTEFTARFTKDDSQTHRLGYTVAYYKNGLLVEVSPVVYGAEAWIGDATSLTVKEGNEAGEIATSGKFPGYHFEKLTLNGTTDIETPFGSYDLTLAANAASSEDNVFRVYYVEDANITINYVANEGGTVSVASEQVAPATGAASGSTATAATGYVFDYWSTDAAGQNKVCIDNLFVPERNAQGIYEAATYYANFKLSEDKHVVAYEIHYFKQNAAGVYEEAIDDVVAKKTSAEQHILTPATITVTESLDKNKYEGYVYSTATEAMNGGAAVTITDFPSSYTNDTQAAGEEEYVINCYYDLRTDLSYTVKYYWAGDTSTTIAADETVAGQTYNATVSLPANKKKEIAGYTYKGDSGDITIAVSGNVINVYYYKNVELTANSDTKPYNGAVQSVAGFTGAPADAQFSIAVGAAGVAAGTYPARFATGAIGTVDGTGNYIVSSTVDGELEISPLNVTVQIVGNNATNEYDGNAHAVEGYIATASSALFTDDLISFTGTATATRTEVGTTYMGLAADRFASDDTNNFNVAFTIVADGFQAITPVSAEVIVDVYENARTVTYDGAKHSVAGYERMVANNSLYDVAASVTETPTSAWTAEGVLAGTYPVGIAAEDFTNTNGNFSKVTFVIHDGALVIDDRDVPDSEVVSKTHDTRIDGTAATDLGKTITFDITVKNIYNETKIVTLEEKEGFVLSETAFALAAGQEKTVTATHVVTESDLLAGEIENVVTAKFGDVNRTATDTVTLTKPYANLVVDKTANVAQGAIVKAGDAITYTITVHNDGNISIHDVTVTDELLGKEWTIQTLGPQQTVTFTEDYTITQADSNRGYVTNVAVAKGKTEDPDNPNPGGEGNITVPVETQVPALVLTKKADVASGAAAGDVITYTITATNNGTSLLTNVVIDDPLTGDRWNIDQLIPGASRSFTTTYTVTSSDAEAGLVTNTVTGTADNPTNVPTTVTPAQATTTTIAPTPGTTPDESDSGTSGPGTGASTGNPTLPATYDGHSCWVHWLMFLGLLLTLIYGTSTMVRRKKFADDVAALDEELTCRAFVAEPKAKREAVIAATAAACAE